MLLVMSNQRMMQICSRNVHFLEIVVALKINRKYYTMISLKTIHNFRTKSQNGVIQNVDVANREISENFKRLTNFNKIKKLRAFVATGS